jgi:hypothetical protein
MPSDEGKGYPMMPIKSWWALRKKFRTTIPGAVTPSYLAAALSITETSARNNILPTLRKTGLVDDNGKPLPLANDWRNDAKYPEVCKRIRSTLYPQEIRDLAPDKSASRDQVQGWFASHTASGESAAQKMASFYLMLLEANPATEAQLTVKQPKTQGKAPQPKRARKTKEEREQGEREERSPANEPSRRPSIHLDVQIHLPSDATVEQIEAIFSNMAKYLKDLD